MTKRPTTRRGFLKAAAALPLAGVLAHGQPAPSNRIVMATIGCGGQGRGDMNGFMGFPEVQMVAVCDPVPEHRRIDRHRDRARAEDPDVRLDPLDARLGEDRDAAPDAHAELAEPRRDEAGRLVPLPPRLRAPRPAELVPERDALGAPLDLRLEDVDEGRGLRIGHRRGAPSDQSATSTPARSCAST